MNKINSEDKPLISVILSVYNGGEYLKLAVDSVLQQSLRTFEFLIIDDCSTDDSLDYLESIKDSRIKIYEQENNQGLFTSLNMLIKECRTNLIKLWSQDDIMYKNCLEKVVDFHKTHPAIGFSYSGRDMIDEKGIIRKIDKIDNTPEIISTSLHSRIAYYTGSIAGNIANVCINKSALDRVGLFNDQMKISADFDMWVRLAEHNETGFIKDKLIQLRDHSGQLSRNEKYYINHVKEDLEVYSYLDNYVTSSEKKEGHEVMRNNKLIFYYTLMLKTLLKGRLKNFAEYFKALAAYDNIFLLTFNFIKVKLFGKKKTFQI